MTDREIRTGIDNILEQLRELVAEYARQADKFERLADTYWRQMCAVKAERAALVTRVNNLEAMACASPACQLCQGN